MFDVAIPLADVAIPDVAIPLPSLS